jgi:hypothetical protein
MVAGGRVVAAVLVGGALLAGCGGKLMGTSFEPGKVEEKPVVHKGVYLNISVGLPPDRARLEAVSKLAVANLDRLLKGR